VADWPDLGLILALLLGNSTIAYWEETQAGNAIAALKAQLTPKATVLRDGTWKVMDAADLVPGGILLLYDKTIRIQSLLSLTIKQDIIRIKLGDVAPADLKMLSGENVKADQSALTGESIPVGKGVGDEIFSGSVIKMGVCIPPLFVRIIFYCIYFIIVFPLLHITRKQSV
jgi:H+-transporting ATPase